MRSRSAARTAIRYGLGAIKGLGRAAAEHICARARRGRRRTPACTSSVAASAASGSGGGAIEALIKAGALDGLGPNRASLMAALPARSAAPNRRRDRAMRARKTCSG